MKIIEYFESNDKSYWLGEIGKLVDHAITLAKADGYSRIYVSTLEDGLYEKYGFRFLQMMPDVHGDDSKVYVRDF